MDATITEILNDLQSGRITLEEATAKLRFEREADLGYARVDLHRKKRRGMPEVIFGQGKTPDQVGGILTVLWRNGQSGFATRVSLETSQKVCSQCPDIPLIYDEMSRCLYTDVPLDDRGEGTILVVSAGTSDLPVAQEAALTARLAGNRVETLTDVGVAGLHRLLQHLELLRSANVLIVCAGMEGALPSVVAGLVSRPVIAVPTSVGYGASFEGITALLSMINSCAAGVTVVNIDNGFGAGYAASTINRRLHND